MTQFDGQEIQTRWVVITGAPSSGKTTVIDWLREMGYACVAEASREHINGLIAAGISREDRIKLRRSYQPEILGMRITAEQTADPNRLVFFDRAVPDSLIYFQHYDLPIDPIQAQMAQVKYSQVFLFALLPFEEDEVRVESAARAAEMEQELLQSYRFFGYEPIIVPVMPIEERIQFILDRVEE